MKYVTKERVLFIIIGFLLWIRLGFFLKDGTNDTVETLLFTSIFILSVYALIVVLQKNFIHVINDKNYWNKGLLVIYLITLDLMFQLHNNISIGFAYLFALLLILCSLLIISLALPKRMSNIYDITVAVIAFVYVLAQDIYLRIFEGLFLLRDFATAKEGADFATGIYTFSIFHIMYALLLIIFMVTYFMTKPSFIPNGKHQVVPLIKTVFILFLLFNFNAIYPVKSARLHTSDHYLLYSNFSPLKAASRFGLPNLFFRDAISLFALSRSNEQEITQIESYLEKYPKTHLDNAYSGVFAGKNVVFIVGESYDELALSETLTPNLYQLKNEGLDFINYYTPVYPRTTCDTEIIFNTGLIPSINDGPTCYQFNQNSYRNSLASLFNQTNYQTTSLHANYEEFYTREILYPNLGYDHFLGQNKLNLSDTNIRYDSTFLQASLPYLTLEDTPFFTFMITLSGHSPYSEINLAAKEHYPLVDEYYGDSIPESVKYYIATQIEVDKMVGELMIHLEEHNQLEDTVIVFTNDHYPYTLDNDDYEQVTQFTDIHEKQKGALYIWHKNITPNTIDSLSSSFDIIPTMINMFDLDGHYSEYIGNDIFDEQNKRIVYFKDYYIAYQDELYDLSSSTNGLDDSTYAYVQDTYKYAINVLRSNYYQFD